MNRVRIVAVTAVALGAAVVAGTHFQSAEQAAPAPVPMAQAPLAPEAPSLATLAPAAAPQPAASLVSASILPQPEAPIAGASILSGVDVPRAELPLPGPDPVAERLAQVDPAPTTAAEPLDPELQAELNACAVWLVVTPAADAMLETSIYAPCDAGEQVTLSHAGLTFGARIGADGQMMMLVPALTEQASVTLAFADGREQSDSTLVPDLAGIERVALFWQGPATLALHAYEFGAQYGDPGHIHPGSPLPMTGAEHGFVTMLGDPALQGSQLAQIYSFPRGTSSLRGQVSLEIEIPVTDASCGVPLQVGAIEVHGIASAQARQIRLDMPECDGNGGYLVLPGILPELQIALN